MESWTKVADDIYLVKQPMGDIFTGIYVILGKRVVVIDTGLEASPEDYLFPFLRSAGRNPRDISLVINTHGHGDHIDGNPGVREASGARIMAHELDAVHVEQPDRISKEFCLRYPWAFQPPSQERVYPRVDMPLKDGDIIGFEAGELRVLHTPGHSHGSMALLWEERGILFTGDTVQGYGTGLPGALIFGETDNYLCSMTRLLRVNFDTMLPAHAYRPATSSILSRTAGRDLISRSIALTHLVSAKITAILEGATKPLPLREVAQIYGDNPVEGQGAHLPTIESHLRRLRKEGAATSSLIDGEAAWSKA